MDPKGLEVFQALGREGRREFPSGRQKQARHRLWLRSDRARHGGQCRSPVLFRSNEALCLPKTTPAPPPFIIDEFNACIFECAPHILKRTRRWLPCSALKVRNRYMGEAGHRSRRHRAGALDFDALYRVKAFRDRPTSRSSVSSGGRWAHRTRCRRPLPAEPVRGRPERRQHPQDRPGASGQEPRSVPPS